MASKENLQSAVTKEMVTEAASAVMTSKKGKKIFVLDTNVLLHDPTSMYSFEGAAVGIPIIALEELDKFKSETTDRGRNARDVIRRLDEMRTTGSLREGVPLENGGTLKILFSPEEFSGELPFRMEVADNDILLSALALKKQGYDVRFISKDINARVKADVIGIYSEDYLKGKVARQEFYKGWQVVEVPAVELKKGEPAVLQKLASEKNLMLNEFVEVRSANNPHNFVVFRYLGQGKFKAIAPELSLKWPLQARNPQQLMAFDLLMDTNIQLVSLLGPAGTGKTFLGMLAGLYQVLVDEKYEKVLVARPVVPLGPDIGYLPGDMSEKLHAWMQPIYDNVDLIAYASAQNRSAYEIEGEEDFRKKAKYKKGGKKHKDERHHKNDRYNDDRSGKPKGKLKGLDALIEDGKVSLEAITYMRGRSIPFQYILIDEVQNLSPHEVKTIVSRVGQDSKMILCGDPFQIDSPYLDFSSNGLVVASNKFKGNRIFGTVFLEHSERSELSRLAGELL